MEVGDCGCQSGVLRILGWDTYLSFNHRVSEFNVSSHLFTSSLTTRIHSDPYYFSVG